MTKSNWLARLQVRWGLKSTRQTILVLIVFALTGTTAAYLKSILFSLAGIGEDTSRWISVPYWFISTLFVYQFLLLGYGYLFGLFGFFWNFEKRMWHRIRGKKKNRQDR